MKLHRLTIVVGLTWVALLTLATPAWAQQDISPNEERLYRLFESHIQLLTSVITILGIVFIAFQIVLQIYDYRRQASARQRMDDYTEKTTKMIEAMTGVMEGAKSTQTGAEKVMKELGELRGQFESEMATLKAQRNKELEEKSNVVRQCQVALGYFLRNNHRFKVNQVKLSDAYRSIAKLEALNIDPRGYPPEVWLVQGYYHSIISGDNNAGILSFSELIDNEAIDREFWEAALLNRGINYANLNLYSQGIEDFRRLENMEPSNLLPTFYRVDTELLQFRQGCSADELNVTQPKSNLASEPGTILDDLRRLNQQVLGEEGFDSDPESPSKLRTRIMRSYCSLLVQLDGVQFEAGKSVLWHSALDRDSAALYLRLCYRRKDAWFRDGQAALSFPDDDADLQACLRRSATEYRASSEGRSKLLRGIITALCYSWSGKIDELKRIQTELEEFHIRDLEKNSDLTAFSPITQRNESLQVIKTQLRSIGT